MLKIDGFMYFIILLLILSGPLAFLVFNLFIVFFYVLFSYGVYSVLVKSADIVFNVEVLFVCFLNLILHLFSVIR